ncbi:MAG: pallilysin-related adhesin [Spirochaetaceae bacterium]|jgi:hypothetical protein|nr:pallilysin-related adhesin [Spirochaetaceae bacterium]
MKTLGKQKILLIAAFVAVAGLIVALIRRPAPEEAERSPAETPRFIVPGETAPRGEMEPGGDSLLSAAEYLARREALSAKVPLLPGETIAAILTEDLNGDLLDEQIIASRSGAAETPFNITYIAFDVKEGKYRRFWSVPVSAARPGTVSLSIQDIIGNRSNCLVVTGMNESEQHTLTIFRQNAAGRHEENWPVIAQISIDGAITIRESSRGQAYRMGQAAGPSHTIIAYGRNPASDNILDQIEITYQYREQTGRFGETGRVSVPGSQIEQRRVRELLSGRSDEFERFISGLWYYVGPQGTLDSRQFIYFDPQNRELIFYTDETQQVFSWIASSVTRYGLYVSSHNVSVTTLRRSIDIELESLSGIRVRVREDVRLPINVSDSWDGSYRKAEYALPGDGAASGAALPVTPWIEAVYDGALGKLVLDAAGNYELITGNGVIRGTYAFFSLAGKTLLELRPGPVSARDTWLAVFMEETLTLTRVRIGTRGIFPLPGEPIPLTRPN